MRKQVILKRAYFTRKRLLFPQQVLHLSREQLSTLAGGLLALGATSRVQYSLTSLFIQFSGFSTAAVDPAVLATGVAKPNPQPAVTEGGRFRWKTGQKREYKASGLVTSAAPLTG